MLDSILDTLLYWSAIETEDELHEEHFEDEEYLDEDDFININVVLTVGQEDHDQED
tara:strand:- start:67134 stop:67301 length:168 start_codon:yes stop_codon:yes gene_type:complete